MSPDDEAVRARIRYGFTLFNERRWDALAGGFPVDFEAIDRAPPDVLRAVGPDALREITTANGDAAFAGLEMEPLEIEVTARGDDVVALVRVAARASGGASAIPVEAEIGQIWTFRGGRAIRFEQFRTWPDAQRAAADPSP